VIDLEIEELQRLHARIGDAFSAAIERIIGTLQQKRKLVVCGVGKSGNIGRKLAATLNSTGATTVLLNAQDALHGDLGILSDGDAVLLLSYSGETPELLDLLPHIKRFEVALIALTGKANSTLAEHSDVTLDTSVDREACPMNLAPTSSSTSSLESVKRSSIPATSRSRLRTRSRTSRPRLRPSPAAKRATTRRRSSTMWGRTSCSSSSLPAGCG
jgi:arabinose-5-phosphate isomerase